MYEYGRSRRSLRYRPKTAGALLVAYSTYTYVILYAFTVLRTGCRRSSLGRNYPEMIILLFCELNSYKYSTYSTYVTYVHTYGVRPVRMVITLVLYTSTPVLTYIHTELCERTSTCRRRMRHLPAVPLELCCGVLDGLLSQ